MKKAFFTVLLLFFAGCSTKSVTIYGTAKAQSLEKKLQNIKVANIKNDTAGVKKALIDKIRSVNMKYPSYLNLNENSKYAIMGKLINRSFKKAYTKKLKIKYKKPRCVYILYPCKDVSGRFFCQYDKPIKIYDKNRLKNIYKNPPYILYESKLYKMKQNCKPQYKTVKCQKYSISLKLDLKIQKEGKTIFDQNYYYNTEEDPCKNINFYENTHIYKPATTYSQALLKGVNAMLDDFIKDIAPHSVTYYAPFEEKADADLNNKDEKLFKNALDYENNLQNAVESLKKLIQKHPQSCVFKYDLALLYAKNYRYKSARDVLSTVKGCKNSQTFTHILNLKTFLNSLVY